MVKPKQRIVIATQSSRFGFAVEQPIGQKPAHANRVLPGSRVRKLGAFRAGRVASQDGREGAACNESHSAVDERRGVVRRVRSRSARATWPRFPAESAATSI